MGTVLYLFQKSGQKYQACLWNSLVSEYLKQGVIKTAHGKTLLKKLDTVMCILCLILYGL